MHIAEDPGELSDSDIIVRMLYFCEEAKLPSQIMNYCRIDGIKFRKFTGHCIKRGLLRAIASEMGLFAMQTTDRGRQVLETVDSIMAGLGLEQDEPLR
jgi:predicted transcriptional regulator